MSLLFVFLFIAIGLIFGSFISVLSYRLPREIPFSKGRSLCPKCKKKIAWYDNIPLVSFILLKGECRNCGKKISYRYPIIEIITSLSFVGLYFAYETCFMNGLVFSQGLSPFCESFLALNFSSYIFSVFILVILLSIFFIDIEEKIIPDGLVTTSFSVSFLFFLLSNHYNMFEHFLAGFISSLFLLLIFLVTKGKGMGLGDVKLTYLLGFLLGLEFLLSFYLVAFLTGAFVGIILILVKKAKFGQEIPFGPFLIVGFITAFIWGNKITQLLTG